MSEARAHLFLSPGAEEAWNHVVQPWLATGRGRLARRLVVVPTRGQALVWKQRCVRAGLPLLGVEFLTPGLARRKWLPLVPFARPVLGREFLLLGLRGLVADRLANLPPDAPSRGVWQSLRSDPERALAALDDLLAAGFAPCDFPRRELAALGFDLQAWADRLGHVLGPAQAIAAALDPLPPATAPLADDVLVLGLGPENAAEFFNVAALVRRCARATVIAPAPALRGAADPEDPAAPGRPDEAWVARWERFLQVESVLLEPSARAAPDPQILLAADRATEAALIIDRLATWLREGSDPSESAEDLQGDLGVIFPGPGPLHRAVSQGLRKRGVPHHDLVGRAAAPPIDTQLLRGVVDFWARGARLDEALALWPRLRALNLAGLEARYADFRAHVDECFHATCDHALADADPAANENETTADAPGAADLRRLAAALLPGWPETLSVAAAVARLRAVASRWDLALPEGFAGLDAFAALEPSDWPRELVAELLLAFLPEVAEPLESAPHQGGFARVILATRRRAEGAPWARLLLAQANAGEWPRRREPNPWLGDAERLSLNRSGRGLAPLLTSEDASALERAGHEALLAEPVLGRALSAAAVDEAEPDRPLAPNGPLERLLWARGERRPQEALAAGAAHLPPAPPASAEVAAWSLVRAARRDPARPFDAFFLCLEPTPEPFPLPSRLSPSTLEKSLVDPAVLWFRGLLRLEPGRREPLARALPLRRGQVAHRLLATALRPAGCRDGEWGPLKTETEARSALENALATERARHAGGWYWNAEHGRLETLCRALLRRFYATGAGDHVVVECWLPEAARLTLPGWTIPVRGRMDIARGDRPEWTGANIHLCDYKSGGAEKALDAERMAARAESLQLAVYLDAVRSLGVTAATVWKITADEASSLGAEELDTALAALPPLMDAMSAGRYGALTPDRNPHGGREPWPWPLACTPIPARDLLAKYTLTFGASPENPDAKDPSDV